MASIKAIIKSWQDKGVPVFFIRDNGKPSVSLTLLIISSTIVAFGLINGAANLVKGIDMQSALYWNGMTVAAYLQRKFSKKDGLGDSVNKSENSEK